MIRNTFLDMLKGITITLVVLGHTIQYITDPVYFYGNPVFIAIYSFHMPLFMAISGYLFYHSLQKPVIEILTKKINHLIVPLLIWTLIEVVCRLVFQSQNAVGPMAFIHKYLSAIPRTFWFIWVLFICTLIATFMFKYLNKWYWHLLFFLMLFALPDFVSMNHIKNMYPYFIAGILFKKHEIQLKNVLHKIVSLSMVLYTIGIWFWSDKLYIYTTGMEFIDRKGINYSQIGIDALRFLIGFTGCACFIFLCQQLHKRIKFNFADRLGSKSLGIYLIHLLALRYILFKTPDTLNPTVINQIPQLLLWSAFILLVAFYLSLMLSRSFYLNKYLFGESPKK
jgi:fucose 4-O-acetylase-like acetyltransferase